MVDMSVSTLVLGMVFGAIGAGFFIYGRKQGKVMPLVVGIALSALPYVTSNPWVTLLLGVVLVALPYWFRD